MHIPPSLPGDLMISYGTQKPWLFHGSCVFVKTTTEFISTSDSGNTAQKLTSTRSNNSEAASLFDCQNHMSLSHCNRNCV